MKQAWFFSVEGFIASSFRDQMPTNFDNYNNFDINNITLPNK